MVTDGKFYLQLTTMTDADSPAGGGGGAYTEMATKKPRIKCDTEILATEVLGSSKYA